MEAGATEIILDQASADIFPQSWRGGKVAARADRLLDSQSERLQNIIERALAQYPQEFLNSTLTQIYGLGHLEYRGIATGGTRSANSIYIVCKPHFPEAAIERNIHAEYSSILFRKFSQHFDSDSWHRQNPAGFEYLGSGSEAVKAGEASSRFDASLHQQGFLHQYSKASIEEDFNSHVARLFTGDNQYWQTLDDYPRCKAKARMVINFYNHLHSQFTEVRFQEIRRQNKDTSRDSSPAMLPATNSCK